MITEARKRLGNKCSRCGYDKCSWALDFHHIDPTNKNFNIGNDHNTKSWEKFWEEAQKCELICANCHREEHYNQYIQSLEQ